MTSLHVGGRGALAGLGAVDALGEVLVLVEGSSRATGTIRWLAPNVSTWIASPEQGLTAEIESASGLRASADALERLAPSRLAVVASVRSERVCWAEIIRHSDAEP